MNIIPIPAISTTHLCSATMLWLERHDLPFLLAPHDHGIFMVLAAEHHYQDLPKDLVDIFKYVAPYATHGWLMLDVDGDVMPGLPTYR